MTDKTRSDDHVSTNDHDDNDDNNDNDDDDNVDDGREAGEVSSSKRPFDESDSSEPSAKRSSLEAMVAKARAINAKRAAELSSLNTPLAKSNLFAHSASSKLGISRANLFMDDPEEVDNKLHLWRTNYCSVNAEGEETPEPTFLELYDNNGHDARRAFSGLCFQMDCSLKMLGRAGIPESKILDVLSQNSVQEVKRIISDCDQSTNSLQTSQTFVTTHVPALTKLAPNLVADFAKRLLGDFNIGQRYNLAVMLATHVKTLTVLFRSKGLIKMGEDVGIWSLWPVPTFCENLLKVIPRDSSLTALTVALVQQLANIRHDFGDPPTYDTVIAFLELVNTIIHDSAQVLTPATEPTAVKVSIAGLIATKHPDKTPRFVQPSNIQLNLELTAEIASIPTVEVLLTRVVTKLTDAIGRFANLCQWASLGASSKQNNTYDKNKDKKGFHQSNSSHGSNLPNTNNQNKGNTSGNDRQNQSNVSTCPGGKCFGCGRSHPGPGKLCTRPTCKGHPDRNTSDVPFLQSAAHNKQKARNYQYAHELDTKLRADGSPLSEADLAKIASFKGQNNNKSDKKPKNKYFNKSESLAIISDEIVECLPQFRVFFNTTNHLIVDTLLDTGALQGNYLSEELAAWLIDQGAVPVHNGAISIQLAVRNSTTTSTCSLVFNVTFLNESNGLPETIFGLKARILDSEHDLIIGRPVIRLHSLCDKIPSFFKLDDSSAPVVSQFRLSEPSHAHSHPFCISGDTVKRSEGILRAIREREIQRPPLADQQLCVIGEIKAKQELIDTAPDLDHVKWADNPFDVSIDSDPINVLSDTDITSIIELHGSSPLQRKLRDLCKRYSDIFSVSVRSNPAQIPPMELKVDNSKWKSNKNRGPPRPQSRDKQKEIAKQVNNYLKLGVIKPVNAEEYSQVHLVPKPTPNEWRFCLDFVRLNNCTDGVEGWPIPNIKHMLDRIGERKSRIFGVMDMTSGYHQAPISASSQILTSFICFMGIFCWLRVPMGLKNAASYFQRVMATVVLIGLIYLICELYIDDILVFGKNEDDFIDNLEKVFKRLRQYNVTLNPKKCRFGMDKVEYVGHVISYEGITFSDEKRVKVLDFPLPNTQKDLQAFLGLVNYFRDHVPDMTGLVKPLRVLIDSKKKNQR